MQCTKEIILWFIGFVRFDEYNESKWYFEELIERQVAYGIFIHCSNCKKMGDFC